MMKNKMSMQILHYDDCCIWLGGVHMFQYSSKRDILSAIKEGKLSAEAGMKLLSQKTEDVQSNKENINVKEQKADLFEQTLQYLTDIASEELGIPKDRIKPKHKMEDYGIDSVMVVGITRRLERDFGELSKTIFFEYQTLYEVAEYFVENYKDRLNELFQFDEKTTIQEPDAETYTEYKTENTEVKTTITQITDEEGTSGYKKSDDDIAIIGVSGKYPMADDLDEFWRNLMEGKDCITEIPKERWDASKYYDQERGKEGKTTSKWGGFINDVDKFDPLFFNLSPKEAEFMDPQERLFLETAWHSFEDAGYTRERLSKKQVGVFAGVMYGEYQLYGAEETAKGHTLALSSSYAAVANRVSYLLDLQGPSITLDTMCSSSLTTIHLACESLKRGECNLAVAGGVNVSIHPNKYLILGQCNFAASDGRCRSFGKDGDGYVPGEGVGAVILKRFSDAKRDNDRIYAVIKGSAINHGGKTNGYTVPNPNAQAGVINEALRVAKVNPRTISYLEAHGTGTSLGDPIEITGLKKAYGQYTKDKNYCFIGSVKSNIGHLESAAGIAAVTKVLLQMKYKKLVPSIHSDVLNPNINFLSTPFMVEHKYEDWKRPVVVENGKKVEYPRRAGISAFGAGGSNAHLIMEEYENPQQPVQQANEFLIPVSARNEKQLKVYVKSLVEYLDRHEDITINDVAYTMQTGREGMSRRVVFLSQSIMQLKDKMMKFINGNVNIDGVFYGRADEIEDEIQEEKIRTAWNNHELQTVASLWIEGTKLDFESLYKEKRHIVTLPGYPFARERYWVPEGKETEKPEKHISEFIDFNESTLELQCYSKTIYGNEYYTADHIVNGEKVVPGAVFVEMIQEAGMLALRNFQVLRLENIVFEHMLKITEEPVKIYIRLIPQRNKIVCQIAKSSSLEDTFCYCRADIIYGYEEEAVEKEITAIDMAKETDFSADEYYEEMKKAGFLYKGPFQVIKDVELKEEKAYVLLDGDEKGEGELTFLPALLDGAFQSVSFLLKDRMEKEQALYVPYMAGEITSYAPLEKNCICIASEDAGKSDDVISFHIKIYNQSHEKIVEINHYAVKKVTGVLGGSDYNEDILYASTEWIKKKLIPAGKADYKKLLVFCNSNTLAAEIQNSFTGQMILVNAGEVYAEEGNRYTVNPFSEENFRRLSASLQAVDFKFDGVWYLWNQSELSAVNSGQIAEGMEAGTAAFLMSKTLLCQTIKRTVSFIQIFYQNGKDALPEDLAVISLTQTTAQENPLLKVKSVIIKEAVSERKLINRIKEECLSSDTVIQYDGTRYVKGAKVLECNSQDLQTNAFEKNSIVLITGGLGELGYIFAKKAAKQSAVIILCGRSALNEKGSKRITELEKIGADKVQYLQMDGSNLEQIRNVIDSVFAQYGRIDYILHCAGVLRDSLLVNKTADDFQAVLASKLICAKNLDQAVGDRAVKYMIYFSSISSLAGNVGQADYSYANAFLDELAKRRNQTRSGRTVSINWPLWKQGGMLPDANSIAWMKENLGLDLLELQNGYEAFALALSEDVPQFIVLPGDKKKILPFIGSQEPESIEEEDTRVFMTEDTEENLFQKAADYIGSLIASELHIREEKMDVEDSFDKYGIDSIMIVGLIRNLEETFGKLPKTLFFECQNLRQLTDYFLKNHYQKLLKEIGGHEVSDTQKEVKAKGLSSSKEKTRKTLELTKRFLHGRREDEPVDIAVIGLSGQYPMADDVEEFFQNLMEGRDCITEIPEERWDKNQNFDPGKGKRGKTYSKWGGFLHNIDEFDPLFFHISPVEAQITDPQERLFLQNVWHTMEDAGYTRDRLSKYKTGVYVGAMYGHYQMYGVEEAMRGNVLAVGSSFASIANRVSYFLNLQGPSMAVDTMCSSSLTSIHLACESIRRGECEMAFAGGVNLSLHPNKYILLSQSKFMSTDGRCRSFGEGGDGYVPGEGVGSVLLKPLELAKRDGDYIYGVIKATALNHGGKTNGYTVPNPLAQTEVIKEALRKADVKPEMISYVEAHGTGTALGDPIEISGMANAFASADFANMHCSVGSVKSNIGHLESAAGIAAVTKVLMQMKYKKLVPSIHSAMLNQNIDFSETPFTIQQTLEDWEQPKIQLDGMERKVPRYAGISSFGAGGSNAHIIIEEYDKPQEKCEKKEEYLFVLSAQNEDRLKEYAKNVLTYLNSRCIKKQLDTVQVNTIDRQWVLKEITKVLAELKDIDSAQIDAGTSISELGLDIYQFQIFLDRLQEQIKVKRELEVRYLSPEQLADNICREKNSRQDVLPSIKEENVMHPDFNLDSFIYTYQVGREAMEERLAFVIHNVKELIEKLNQYIAGERDAVLNRGNIRTDKERVQLILDSGDIGKKFVNELVTKGNLKDIAKIWCSGIDIDFQKLYGEEMSVTVSLPGYPFAHERYWIPEPVDMPMGKDEGNNNIAVTPGELEELYLERIWNPCCDREKSIVNAKETTLIIANAENIDKATHIAMKLSTPYIISMVEDASDAIEEKAIDRVIDISDYYRKSEEADEYLTKLQLFQKLIQSNMTIVIRHFTCCTNTFEMEDAQLNGVIFAGFMKNLSAEYKHADIQTTDLDSYDLMQVEQDILSACETRIPYGECCIRNHVMYVPVFRETIQHKNVFRLEDTKNDAWIVTGGTRGIGAEIAKWLVEQGVRKLALIGNSSLPKESEWNSILDMEPQSATASKIRFLKYLKEKEVEVLVSGDGVNEKDKVEVFIQRVRKEFGQIAGVVHCAGISISNNPAFINKKKEDIHKVMLPKTEGIKNLVTLLRKEEVKTFITFSSISSIAPKLAVGISDYAAANSFMNSYAEYQAQMGWKGFKTIIWPSWSETGMGTVVGTVNQEMGLEAFTTLGGLRAFETALCDTDKPIVIPVRAYENTFQPRKLAKIDKEGSRNSQKPVNKILEPTVHPGQKEMKNVDTHPIVQRQGKLLKDEVVEWLRTVFSKELNIPTQRLDAERNFGDYGVDSILIAELVKSLEREIGSKLEPSALLEYPTLSELSDYFMERYSEQISSKFEVTNKPDVKKVEFKQDEKAKDKQEEKVQYKQEEKAEEIKETVQTENIVKEHVDQNKRSKKIAIIGMACNFPKSANIQMFWDNLKNGVDCVTEVPEERWDTGRFYSDKHVKGKSYSKWGGFISGIEDFDPDYFNIDRTLAPHIDPLIRLALEISVDTFNDAGYSKDDIWGSNVGVYIGSRMGQYAHRITEPVKASITGSGQNFIAAHISHFYNLKGPSMVVDSACSSSLTGLHIACQEILNDDVKMAFVAGVDLLLDENAYIVLSESEALSPDGVCYAFDERANGFVPSEGCGAVLLKQLDDAVKDGDRIYAVIDSTAINNDGHTMGITTPNPAAQREVIMEAIKRSGYSPEEIGYIEAHGTGTMIGDPIELKGLNAIFRKETDKKQYCAIGSVKSNLGHMLSAAGMAGLIKVVLALQHKIIPPTIHCEKPNPRFNFKDSPFYPNTKAIEWKEINHKRIAGISSFGFGGTNAHVIVSQFHENDEREYRKSLPRPIYHKERFWFEKLNNEIVQKESVEKKILVIVDETEDTKEKIRKPVLFEIEDLTESINLETQSQNVNMHGLIELVDETEKEE